jgi:hypothetical protein
MSESEMLALNAQVMRDGYSLGRILKRTVVATRHRPSLDTAKSSFFTQIGLRKAYRQLYDHIPKQQQG